MPEMMRELSTFSQTIKQGSDMKGEQQQFINKLSNNLINAKIGKNKSRRESTDGLGLNGNFMATMRIEESKVKGGQANNEQEGELDSFDQINFSDDLNIIEVNLKSTKEFQ